MLNCLCGHAVTTLRRSRHQVLTCPACGQKVFVLPVSPWRSAGRRSTQTVWRAVLAGRWSLPLAAAGVTLLLVVAGFRAVLPRFTVPVGEAREVAIRDGLARADLGRRALAEGSFYQAARELSSLDPAGLTPRELRQLDQLRGQAELLVRLHGRPLQDLLLEALPVHDAEEWKARFRSQHAGKSVVFDDVVARDAAGRPALAVYRVLAGGERARVALEDLRLLWRLPMDPPQRMLFGGRLAELTREEGGGWVFRFEPDSAVLLTDPGAVAACLGPPDADLLALLKRQEQWLTDATPPAGNR